MSNTTLRFSLHPLYAGTPHSVDCFPADNLLTNAVIAYNTWKLNQVLERSKEAGQPIPSDKIHRIRPSSRDG